MSSNINDLKNIIAASSKQKIIVYVILIATGAILIVLAVKALGKRLDSLNPIKKWQKQRAERKAKSKQKFDELMVARPEIKELPKSQQMITTILLTKPGFSEKLKDVPTEEILKQLPGKKPARTTIGKNKVKTPIKTKQPKNSTALRTVKAQKVGGR